MKICVYAICKNEEKFAERWMKSMSEADGIYVLDTGSTDNTVPLLTKLGAHVKVEQISPWRFDVARNRSLELVPDDCDVCVCTDLDEVFEKGWRSKLENAWQKGKNLQANYTYVWNVLPNGKDGTTFLYQKTHTKHHFRWIYPVHEVLECDMNITENEICHCEDIVLRHFPDDTKSRGQYLDLLKLSVAEHPESDRNTHYLAREYMFAGDYPSAIKYFKKHLKLPSATWKEERGASLRYIGDCYLYQNKQSLAKQFYKKSICESPTTREGYLALAKLLYNQKKYFDCYIVLKAMLEITTRNLTYISSPECWDESPYDLLSLCAHYLNMSEEAYKYCSLAVLQNPQDQRLASNLQYFRSRL